MKPDQLAFLPDSLLAKAIALVTQSYWCENTLVSTTGWRRDWIKTFDAGSAGLDTATGLLITDPAIYRVQPRLDQRHDAINYGLVLHTPGFVKRYLPKFSETDFASRRVVHEWRPLRRPPCPNGNHHPTARAHPYS